MKLRLFGALGLMLALATPAAAVPFNVALGAPVTASGVIGNSTFGAWPDPAPAPLSTITDGLFQPEMTMWQTGSVWWNENPTGSPNNIFEIDLGGTFMINQVFTQADNNDLYQISARNFAGVWVVLGTHGAVPGFGLMTRNSGIFGPVQATAFRIDALGGDLFYAVSEFQAIGEAVPEPASLLLLGTGLTAFAARRRRARKAQQ